MNKEHKYKDKDEYKDNDKDKDAERITESLTVCYIFGILTTQASLTAKMNTKNLITTKRGSQLCPWQILLVLLEVDGPPLSKHFSSARCAHIRVFAYFIFLPNSLHIIRTYVCFFLHAKAPLLQYQSRKLVTS